MAAPKLCDKCGTRHHDYQAHVFPTAGSRVTGRVKPPAAGGRVANRGVANGVTNKVANERVTNSLERPVRAVRVRADRGPAASRGTSTERVRAWREKNRARYNEQQRERMRAVRAARRVSP